MFISNAFAQAAGAPPETGSLLGGMLPILLMFAVLYFLMIRPQQKRAKETRGMLEALQKGDEVVTVGGMVGKITKVGESGYLTLDISQSDKPLEVVLQKNAVQMLLPKGTIKSL